MADVSLIRVADLLVDDQNPRLSQLHEGQRDALRRIAHEQDRKLLKLADDILEYGISPADLLIVTETKDEPPRYTVLEGNRRLCAVKALEAPDTFSGSGIVSPQTLTGLRKLSSEYLKNPIDTIRCVVFKNRKEADHWLLLRHTGENEGAGIVPWDSDAAARFAARAKGVSEPFREALDFAQSAGHLSEEDRRRLHTTTFKRLLDTPAVRDKLGLNVKDKKLQIVGDKERVAKAIAWVAHDLINRNISVGQVYDLSKRKSYARKIPKSVIVKATGTGVPASSVTKGEPSKGKRKVLRRPPRDFLIPSDCSLNVQDGRTQQIERELRRLSLQSYPNAVSVLFRVFAELTVNWYINDQAVTVSAKARLGEKLKAAGDHLLKNKKLTLHQVKPVRHAAQAGSYLEASITLLHDYAHNAAMFPAPGDLRSHWDSLQPFFAAIWS